MQQFCFRWKRPTIFPKTYFLLGGPQNTLQNHSYSGKWVLSEPSNIFQGELDKKTIKAVEVLTLKLSEIDESMISYNSVMKECILNHEYV